MALTQTQLFKYGLINAGGHFAGQGSFVPAEPYKGRNMLNRDRLEAFATVVELQSFESAATQLKVTRSAVSQRVRALEETLGCVLLIRAIPTVPTEEGYQLLRHVQALRLMEDETLRLIKGNKSTPIKMALGVNADSLATWFRPALAMLYEELDVSVELAVDDQDHTAQLMRRGEVMGCVSVDAETPKGFVADYLGSMRYVCVANKRFATRYLPNGLTKDAVLETNAVLFNRKDKIHDNFLAAHLGFPVNGFPKHYIPSPEGLYDAVAVGMGYGLVPEEQAKNDLRTGKLVNLVPDMPLDIALYWHHWSIEPNISASVTDCVKKYASAALYSDAKLDTSPRRLRAIG